jgi:hypothetical protein
MKLPLTAPPRPLAGQLDLRDDQRMLHDSLEEERKADAALTKLAKGEVNQDAAALINAARPIRSCLLGGIRRRIP